MANSPPHTNMDLVSVHPEPMATVFTVLCPAGVMLQIAAAKPTIHTTAPTFTEPAGRAVRTDRATALTTVVVTILDEKLVSITAHVMKNRISPITGRFAVRGSSAPVSQELMPTSSFVRQEPSCVAAAVGLIVNYLYNSKGLLVSERRTG